MPTNRKRKRRTNKPFMPWEIAFLTGDESGIRPDTRDAARLRTMRNGPDAFLLYGDRTARQLLKDFPEYKKTVNLPPKKSYVKIEMPTDKVFQGLDIEKTELV